jgi:hypothetical protein
LAGVTKNQNALFILIRSIPAGILAQIAKKYKKYKKLSAKRYSSAGLPDFF